MTRERLLSIKMPQLGGGNTITLAHPEMPYMQVHRKLREEPNPFRELKEWIEDAANHNPTHSRTSSLVRLKGPADDASVNLEQYGPREPTTASSCSSGSALVTHTRCLTTSEVIDSCVSCCLPRWVSSERSGEAFISQAGDNACQVR